MPVVSFKGKEIICEKGANLREVLMENGLNPHNGSSRVVNCFGLGSCGTCAVKITGKVAACNAKEKIRLNVAPHKLNNGLRLSCQIRVINDLVVEKGEGFWGQVI
jgi:ferredoxin